MHRRQFSLSVLAAGATASAGLTSLSALAQTATPEANSQLVPLKEGENFWLVKPALPNEAPAGKVLVLCFFAYSCNHCFDFEPMFAQWAKSPAAANAHIQYVPVSFKPIVEPLARIYYTLETIKRMDLHIVAFRAVQKERQNLIDPKVISNFFAANGLNAEETMKVYNSFGVASKVQHANQLVNAYGIQATPALGIGGQYWTAGAAQSTLVIAEELMAKVLSSASR